jgi:hypothetical protein
MLPQRKDNGRTSGVKPGSWENGQPGLPNKFSIKDYGIKNNRVLRPANIVGVLPCRFVVTFFKFCLPVLSNEYSMDHSGFVALKYMKPVLAFAVLFCTCKSMEGLSANGPGVDSSANQVGGAVVWYAVEYDEYGHESYNEATLLEYGSPVMIRSSFSEKGTASAVITVFDDAGNKIFEDLKEINNGMVEARFIPKITKERLMELREDDSVYFTCRIDNGGQILKSDMIKAVFTFTLRFYMDPENPTDTDYILSSTDGAYHITKNPARDIEQSGRELVLKFRNIIPGKEYTLVSLQEGVSGWDPATNSLSAYVHQWTERFYRLFSDGE